MESAELNIERFAAICKRSSTIQKLMRCQFVNQRDSTGRVENMNVKWKNYPHEYSAGAST